MGYNRNIIRFAFDNPIGSVSDRIITENGIAIFRIIKSNKSGFKELEDVLRRMPADLDLFIAPVLLGFRLPDGEQRRDNEEESDEEAFEVPCVHAMDSALRVESVKRLTAADRAVGWGA